MRELDPPVSAVLPAAWHRYAAPAGHFDEVLDGSGALRPQWAAFSQRSGGLDPVLLTQARARVARQLHDNGVTYNLHVGRSRVRAWWLDVLPHIIPAGEWEPLSAGLRQRARLLEAMAADLYGAQRLLTEGLLPPALVFGHPGFLRPCHGVRPPGGVFLHVVAFDLARGPDGDWRVLATRAQAPSGAGYTLENRLTISPLYSEAFREQHVHRLAPYFRGLQDVLVACAPCESATPHIVLLTPGRYNETYFEHAYLSRYLGFTLAEGADLTVRDDVVFLKTAAGLRRVHAILRRLDDDFCDPLELRADSTLGVPGLVQAWRAGHVLVANAFGSGVLESAALTPFLPAVASALLGEPLRLASVESRWCGHPATLAMARARLHELVVKPAVSSEDLGGVPGARMSGAERAQWLARLEARPEAWVVERAIPLSYAPVWTDGGLESRALVMRVFLASDGRGDYRVLPGGLTRIAADERDAVSGHRGGGSKDTWVLSPSPVEPFSLLPGRLKPRDIVASERPVSSRVGEHLFWLGRYAERSENVARLLRAVLSRLPQRDPAVSAGSPPLIAICRHLELLPNGKTPDPVSTHDIERVLVRGVLDARTMRSLAYDVEQTVRAAGLVRDRLSSDNWRVLNRLGERIATTPPDTFGVAEALELIDQAILALVAVGGLEMAHMTRDDGWRFMSLGRHLERVLYVLDTTGEVARSEWIEDPALLEFLLDLSDSIISYRARFMGHVEWLAVAHLLLFDRRNPRSAAFQLAKLGKHVPALPGGDPGDLSARFEALSRMGLADPDPGLFPRPDVVGDFLARARQLALQLSESLTLRYFSHVDERPHATLL